MHPSSSQFLTEAELKAALGLPSGWSLTRMDALLVGGPRPCGGPGAGQGPLGLPALSDLLGCQLHTSPRVQTA